MISLLNRLSCVSLRNTCARYFSSSFAPNSICYQTKSEAVSLQITTNNVALNVLKEKKDPLQEIKNDSDLPFGGFYAPFDPSERGHEVFMKIVEKREAEIAQWEIEWKELVKANKAKIDQKT